MPAESLQGWEIELLQECLQYNMNIDSAPFRQQLQSSLHNALVRARDSSLAALRSCKPCVTYSSLPEHIQATISTWLAYIIYLRM